VVNSAYSDELTASAYLDILSQDALPVRLQMKIHGFPVVPMTVANDVVKAVRRRERCE
jgi:hypothetical protein